jgi:uncharacterized RDD family membrane protein YckC
VQDQYEISILDFIKPYMKKLSSDALFYQKLIGLVLVPGIFFLFINFGFPKDAPIFIIYIFYAFLAFIVVKGCFAAFKSKRIIYDNGYVSIQNYFNDNTITIAVADVISISKAFSLNKPQQGIKYNMTFLYNGEQQKVSFYKSLELYYIDNLEGLIRIGKYRIVDNPLYDMDVIIAKSLAISVKTRFTSAIMDWSVMTVVAMPFAVPFMIQTFSNKTPPEIGGTWWYIAMIGFALFFCKDCINGQSIGKRSFNQQVVNNKTGQIANPLRCFVRDIFMILWPIEGIMTLINPSRRLGDYAAGTKVISYDPALEKPSLDYPQLIISFAISYILMVGVTYIFP